mgnify:CR=1 FL=1
MEYDHEKGLMLPTGYEQELLPQRGAMWPMSEAPEILAELERARDALASADISAPPQMPVAASQKAARNQRAIRLDNLRQQVMPCALAEETERFLRSDPK